MGMTQESPLIICFGDSLTAGFQSPTGENPQGRDTPYGTVLQDKLGSRARVAVSGICGELTGEMAMRFRDDVLRHAPAYVIILGGTNDLGLNAKPADIMRSLLKMYELTRSAGIEPVAVSVPSLRVNEHPEGGAGLDWVRDHVDRRVALNRLIADYCVSKGIPFVDFFAATSDAETLLLTAACSNDGLHLTTEGYARLAHLVYREVLGPKVAQSQGHSS